MNKGFTLVELLVVISIIVLLVSIVAPAVYQGVHLSRRVMCGSNLKQISYAFRMYLQNNNTIFPGHKHDTGTEFWATDILPYVGEREKEIEAIGSCFMCPGFLESQSIDGALWEWDFDFDKLGYGYNAYFLGLYPEVENEWVTKQWLSVGEVKIPSSVILVADSRPISPGVSEGSKLWWPRADTDGVDTTRHLEEGAISFLDGHASSSRTEDINPTPSDRNKHIQVWDARWPH